MYKHLIIFNHFRESCITAVENSDQLETCVWISRLWSVTLDKWHQLSKKIESENLMITELDSMYKDNFSFDFKRMRDELHYILIYFEVGILSQRLAQFDLWKKFTSAYRATTSIERTRETLKLTKQFTELNYMIAIDEKIYKTWSMKKMDSNLEKIVKNFEKLNQESKIKCLEAFAESLDLVVWLRENAPQLDQLYFLVDRLSNSAGNETNTAPNFAIAKALKESGTAYASLIYKLKTSHAFTDFMELSEKVFSFLKSDPNIADKLLSVRFQVPLLERLQKEGNTEFTSLALVKQINKTGVFSVGLVSSPALTDQGLFARKLGMEDLVTLRFDQENSFRDYSFAKLNELQDLLMLMAPRKSLRDEDESSNIEYFVELFADVARLGRLIAELMERGCGFFERFVANFHCDFQSEIKQMNIIKIGDIELKTGDAATSNLIKSLCGVMEEALVFWSRIVKEMRDSHESLNHFTIAQIKYLRELIKSGASEANLRDMRSLLANLCPNFSLPKLDNAISETRNLFESIKVNNEHNFKLNVDGLGESVGVDFGKEWTKFVSDQIGPSEFGLKYLALVLDLLQEPSNYRREIPGYLVHRGEPNLIICKPSSRASFSNQVLTVLSIYSLNSKAPLPTDDEVLFCDSQTSLEELEIFLRRCFNCHGQKIYTVINSQALSYHTASELESLLFFAKIKRTENYCLVFICDKIKDEGFISSILRNNVVEPTFLDEKYIIKYLNHKLVNLKQS